MQSPSENISKKRVDPAMPFEKALPLEGLRHDPDLVVIGRPRQIAHLDGGAGKGAQDARFDLFGSDQGPRGPLL